MRQAGSCVWFGGFSGNTGAPEGEERPFWTNSFFGHLASDFTVRGEWADLPWGQETGAGELGWQIIMAEVDGEEAITLNVIEVTGGFGGNYLVVPESRGVMSVRLRDMDACLSVVGDDGTDYELASLPLDWSVSTAGLYGPDDELIRLSDSFEISGEAARGSGACGAGWILFADEIELSAAAP